MNNSKYVAVEKIKIISFSIKKLMKREKHNRKIEVVLKSKLCMFWLIHKIIFIGKGIKFAANDILPSFFFSMKVTNISEYDN